MVNPANTEVFRFVILRFLNRAENLMIIGNEPRIKKITAPFGTAVMKMKIDNDTAAPIK